MGLGELTSGQELINRKKGRRKKMHDQGQQIQHLKNGGRRDQLLGLLMILVVITCWVASSFVLKGLFETGVYEKPFFVTYLNVSSLTLYLVPYWLRRRGVDSTCNDTFSDSDTDTDNLAPILSDEEKGQTVIEMGPQPSLESCESTEVSVSETLRLSLTFCILWFMACFTTNTSLSYTSVSSQTILSSTSSLFTLLIGSLAAVERITKHKFYGVVVSFIGVILVTEADSINIANSNEDNPAITRLNLLGDALALIGAVVYGIYSTLLRKSVEDKSSRGKSKNKNKRSLDLHLFFGFVGIFTMLGLWPLLVLLHITGFETFQVPASWGLILVLALSAGITFISDYCWAKAVLLTSPLTVSMGLSISIPVAMLVSLASKFERSSFELSYGYIVGATMVLVSFIIVNRERETSTEECEEMDDQAVVVDIEEIDQVVPSSATTTLSSESLIRSSNYGSIV